MKPLDKLFLFSGALFAAVAADWKIKPALTAIGPLVWPADQVGTKYAPRTVAILLEGCSNMPMNGTQGHVVWLSNGEPDLNTTGFEHSGMEVAMQQGSQQTQASPAAAQPDAA